MQHQDLREFITELEKQRQLKRIQTQVNAPLEMTEICRRTLDKQGSALLFETAVSRNYRLLPAT